MYRPLYWQMVALGAAVLVAGLLGGVNGALAVAFGGGVAVVNVALLLWRWRRGKHDYHCDAARHLRSFHRSALERFFIVGILLATGLGLIGLNGRGLLAGFLVGQLVWILANLTMHERT